MSEKKIGICPYCGRRHSSGSDYFCEAELEGWEVDYMLRQRKDYEGLIAHYHAVVAWRPEELSSLYRLGEAFVLNGEPEKAIELLAEPHHRHPDYHDFQHVLLGALFALGKDETEFDWAEEIPVYRLDGRILDRCLAYLKPKRKPRSVFDLHHLFEIGGYCLFTPDELLGAVRRDDRLIVEGDEPWSAEIRARRKRDPRREEDRGAE